MYNMLTLVGIVDAILFGFFVCIGWRVASRLMSLIGI